MPPKLAVISPPDVVPRRPDLGSVREKRTPGRRTRGDRSPGASGRILHFLVVMLIVLALVVILPQLSLVLL